MACILFFPWFMHIPSALSYIMLFDDCGLLAVLSCVNYYGGLCKRANHVDMCKRLILCLCKRAERFRHGNILAWLSHSCVRGSRGS